MADLERAGGAPGLWSKGVCGGGLSVAASCADTVGDVPAHNSVVAVCPAPADTFRSTERRCGAWRQLSEVLLPAPFLP